MLNDSLRALRNVTLGMMHASNLQFFVPKEAFFEALAPYKHLRLVDAGTGCGRVPEAAAARGFNMLGIDLVPRDGQYERVVFMEAETFPYDEKTWVLMCRPDHSGWAYPTLEMALKRGAGAFYIGLERNFDIDLGEYVGRYSQCWKNVGEDGEDMFLFMPQNLLTSVSDE